MKPAMMDSEKHLRVLRRSHERRAFNRRHARFCRGVNPEEWFRDRASFVKFLWQNSRPADAFLGYSPFPWTQSTGARQERDARWREKEGFQEHLQAEIPGSN